MSAIINAKWYSDLYCVFSGGVAMQGPWMRNRIYGLTLLPTQQQVHKVLRVMASSYQGFLLFLSFHAGWSRATLTNTKPACKVSSQPTEMRERLKVIIFLRKKLTLKLPVRFQHRSHSRSTAVTLCTLLMLILVPRVVMKMLRTHTRMKTFRTLQLVSTVGMEWNRVTGMTRSHRI